MSETKHQYFNNTCTHCGDDVEPKRAMLGYHLCLWCGEEAARTERKSWTVIQEYGKGGYMFVTPTSAPTTLKQTNQKNLRS